MPPLLAVLADFDNTDKHRLLKVAYAAAQQIDIGFVGPNFSGRRMVAQAVYGEIEDGTEIQSFTFDRPTPDMKYDRVNIDMVYAVWHGKQKPTDEPWKEKQRCGGCPPRNHTRGH
jgi:hypothetical protein